MGREVRMVVEGWEHPTDERGRCIGLFDGSFEDAAKDWDDECAKWNSGDFPSYASEENKGLTFIEWNAERPCPDEYMPTWSKSEAVKFMMYETTTEGTPISPAFDTPEDLAMWLYVNSASSFGSSTASYSVYPSEVPNGWSRST